MNSIENQICFFFLADIESPYALHMSTKKALKINQQGEEANTSHYTPQSHIKTKSSELSDQRALIPKNIVSINMIISGI